MAESKVMQSAAQQQANAAYTLGQQQGGSLGAFKAAKRDEYANHIEIERREYDAVIRFRLRGEDYGTLVREITVPLGALEAIT